MAFYIGEQASGTRVPLILNLVTIVEYKYVKLLRQQLLKLHESEGPQKNFACEVRV